MNTFNVVQGKEKLNAATARDLLVRHGLDAPPTPSAETLNGLRRLRESFRPLFVASEAEAVAKLNAMLDDIGCTPQLVRHDREGWHLHIGSLRHSLRERVAACATLGLLLVIRDQGTSRLKRCAGRNCEDVFVDASRNKSRVYCSPRVCGNRANVRAYRERRRRDRVHTDSERDVES